MLNIENKNELSHFVLNFNDISDNITFDEDSIMTNNYQLNKIKITCVILTYNEERCIRRCIDSVVDVVDEIVIVDSGSTDKTIDIINEIDSDKIKILKYSWNNDFSNARNYAIRNSLGDWIVFVDADEELYKNDKFLFRNIILMCNQIVEKENVVCSFQIIEKDMNYVYDDIPRIIYRKGSCRYYGRVHEEIRCNNMTPLLLKLNMALIHDGYNRLILHKKNKLERNIKLLKMMILEEKDNLRWVYFYVRDGMKILNKKELIDFIEKNVIENIEMNHVAEIPYANDILSLYYDLLLKERKINQLINITNELISVGMNNYDTFFYNIIAKTLKNKQQFFLLLNELIQYRSKNFDYQKSQISQDGYHIDLLIGLLLFENMDYQKSKKYFEYTRFKLKDVIDDSIFKKYLQILNSLV